MPRFVLLLHECPRDCPRPTHCDLMLEIGQVLSAWSLVTLPHDWAKLAESTTLPVCSPTNTVEAGQLGDHRLAYLEYEGPVSGDRGSVRRLDEGTFTTRQQSSELWEFTVEGRLLRGEVALQRKSPAETRWQLTYLPSDTATD